MAIAQSALKNASAHLTTSLANVYTCPASTVAVIKHAQVANVDGSAAADVSVALYDASATATYYFCKTVSVAADAGLKPLGDLVGAVLEAGDKIQGQASAADDLDIILSVVEYAVS